MPNVNGFKFGADIVFAGIFIWMGLAFVIGIVVGKFLKRGGK